MGLGDTEDVADVTRRHVVEHAERESIRGPSRHPCQTTPDDGKEVSILGEFARVGVPRRRRIDPSTVGAERREGRIDLDVTRTNPVATTPAKVIHKFVAQCADEPTPERGLSTKRRRRLKGREKGILDQVLSDVPIADTGQCVTEQSIAMTVDPVGRRADVWIASGRFT